MRIFQKLHWISLLVGVLSIILPLIFWSKIPTEIPMHYNAAGVVDNWEDKSSLILLFFVIAMMMGVMSITVYFVKSNLISQYSTQDEKSTMSIVYPMIILMNLVLQCMFAYITFCSVTGRNLGTLFLPIVVIGTVAPLGYMVYRCVKLQTTSPSQKVAYKVSEKEEKHAIVYRTAVDWWLGLLLGGTEAYMIYLAVWPVVSRGEMDWAMLLITVGVSLVLAPLFFIKYVLYSEHLLVSMGFYGKVRVRYDDITGVKETFNPLSSAAMSLRRIQIDYVENGVHRMVLVSPVRRKEFMKKIEALRE